MDLMNRVFRPFFDMFIVIFIEDILEYFICVRDHEDYLRIV